MAPRVSLAAPTIAALQNSSVVPATSPAVSKTITKLSRPSLISLALQWLSPKYHQTCVPYLAGDGDDEDEGIYSAAQSLEELREVYRELQKRKGGKREVVDRVVEGDWRHGLSLQQLAMADVQYLWDHPTAQRWTALKLVRIQSSEGSDSGYGTESTAGDLDHLPRFHAATFMQNVQREVNPVVKAHYYLTRADAMPITLLRIYIHDSPYGNQRSVADSAHIGLLEGSKTVYVAFPDNTSFVYVSLVSTPGQTSGGDGKSLRKIILEAIPKALSRPHERYTLKTTSLSARTLSALLAVRGGGRGNAAAGGWSIFAEGTLEDSPLTNVPATSEPPQDDDDQDELGGAPTFQGKKRRRRPSHGSELSKHPVDPTAKRRKLVARNRFGETGLEDDQKGIERLDIRIEDAFPDDRTGISEDIEVDTRPGAGAAPSRRGRRSTLSVLDEPVESDNSEAEAPPTGWIPDVTLTFSGSHIFAGLRKLVESGAVDGEKMPGWMTGEASVSIGVVRNGRIRGNKGSGT